MSPYTYQNPKTLLYPQLHGYIKQRWLHPIPAGPCIESLPQMSSVIQDQLVPSLSAFLVLCTMEANDMELSVNLGPRISQAWNKTLQKRKQICLYGTCEEGEGKGKMIAWLKGTLQPEVGQKQYQHSYQGCTSVGITDPCPSVAFPVAGIAVGDDVA